MILKKKSFYLGMLLLVWCLVVALNFPYGKWFSGWDNLHPEFNLGLNINRALSVWQEKGLGFIGGHGYMASLPHTFVIALMSVFLPVYWLRSGFTFLMLLVGGLGCFWLINSTNRKKDSHLSLVASTMGGLFYMLNLGTVQNFFIQLEAFIIHYAVFPWLLYSFWQFLNKRTKKSLLIWVGVSLLSSAQGFIPPLFIVSSLFLGIIGLGYWFKEKTKKAFKGLVMASGLFLVVNSYWLLPVGYFTVFNSQTYVESYNNLLSTEDFVSRNKQFGDLKEVVLLKGFIMDAKDTGVDGRIFYFMKPWRVHLDNPWVLGVGYVFFGVILFGLYQALFKSKSIFVKGLGVCFALGFTALASSVWPFSIFSKFLSRVPVLNQAFRVSFTKFSIALSLMYSVFFALGVKDGALLIKGKSKNILVAILTVGLVYFSWPVFKGEFLYERIKLDFPQQYLNLFDYFKDNEVSGRIANFPQGWNWGWSVYDWGYSGSGFLWYGIEQPIMDRAFDVWSDKSENYYWETIKAVMAEDYEGLERVFEKYDIAWLLFDESVVAYQNQRAKLYSDKFKSFLSKSNKISLEANFGEIDIYKVRLDNQPDEFVKIEGDLVTVGPEYDWNDEDVAHREYGDYVVSQDPEVYYPFRSLFTGRKQEELEFEVEEKDNQFVFKAKVPENLEGYSLVTPKFEGVEEQQVAKEPKAVIVDGELQVEILKDEGGLSFDSKGTQEIIKANKKSCNPFNTGEYEKQGKWTKGGETTWFRSVGSSNCVNISLSNLSQNLGYLVQVDSRHIEGKSLLFYIINQMSQSRVIETELPKSEGRWSYIVPPMEEYGLGYSVNFDNISIGKQETINELKRVKVYPIPYRFLKQIKLVKDGMRNDQEWQGSFEVKHPNPSFYKISLDGQGEGTLVLSQSFDKGWVGYKERLFGERLDKKVLINNWSNGWEITGDEQKIILWFWPQALEYLGFGGLIIAIGIVLRTRSRQRRLRLN